MRKKWIFFKFLIFLENTSWPVCLNIQLDEVMMSYPHNLPHTSLMKLRKMIFFGQMQVKVYPCIEICQNKLHISFILGRWKVRFTFAYMKNEFFLSFSVSNMLKIVRVWHHQPTLDRCSHELVKKGFPKVLETWKCHNFCIFIRL